MYLRGLPRKRDVMGGTYLHKSTFVSMRSKENNQTLNEEMFHKLTGGWS